MKIPDIKHIEQLLGEYNDRWVDSIGEALWCSLSQLSCDNVREDITLTDDSRGDEWDSQDGEKVRVYTDNKDCLEFGYYYLDESRPDWAQGERSGPFYWANDITDPDIVPISLSPNQFIQILSNK